MKGRRALPTAEALTGQKTPPAANSNSFLRVFTNSQDLKITTEQKTLPLQQIHRTMKYKVKVTVIDKKLYPELQEQYCADPNSGMCPCYNVGDEFIFERDENNDHFWHGGINTLVKTNADPNTVAGGPKLPHCSEAWDAISRYIYAGLQGGSIMKNWMKHENEMICCCSDGTRPVIFKVERIDVEE